MARRGDELRQHILWTAKDVFLEMGFERASMDVVAARAARHRSARSTRTSKARTSCSSPSPSSSSELYLGPARHALTTTAHDAAEAVALFCGRFLQTAAVGSPRCAACRLFIAEADRLPEVPAGYYNAVFETAHERLAAFLTQRCRLSRIRRALTSPASSSGARSTRSSSARCWASMNSPTTAPAKRARSRS